MTRLFLKGIIRLTGIKAEFEVLEEEFFMAGLSKDYPSAEDFGLSLNNEMKNLDWHIVPKGDNVYAVMLEINYTTLVCGYTGEYDSHVDVVNFSTLFLGTYDDLYSDDDFKFTNS